MWFEKQLFKCANVEFLQINLLNQRFSLARGDDVTSMSWNGTGWEERACCISPKVLNPISLFPLPVAGEFGTRLKKLKLNNWTKKMEQNNNKVFMKNLFHSIVNDLAYSESK
jgi:hypothetical protein